MFYGNLPVRQRMRLLSSAGVIAGAIYPVVTLIPVYIPIMTTIAVCMNGKSDHKFFKAMLELKQFASLCKHDYSKELAEDAGKAG